MSDLNFHDQVEQWRGIRGGQLLQPATPTLTAGRTTLAATLNAGSISEPCVCIAGPIDAENLKLLLVLCGQLLQLPDSVNHRKCI